MVEGLRGLKKYLKIWKYKIFKNPILKHVKKHTTNTKNIQKKYELGLDPPSAFEFFSDFSIFFIFIRLLNALILLVLDRGSRDCYHTSGRLDSSGKYRWFSTEDCPTPTVSVSISTTAAGCTLTEDPGLNSVQPYVNSPLLNFMNCDWLFSHVCR